MQVQKNSLKKFGTPIAPPIVESSLTAHDWKIKADMSKDLKNCLWWGGEEIGNDITEDYDPSERMPIIKQEILRKKHHLEESPLKSLNPPLHSYDILNF